jgi:branched-chain amino acid transport system substrate-binding protein
MKNKMVRGKGLGIIMAIALTALLLVAACAPASPLVERKVVEMGTINSLTGAGSRADQLYLSGQLDYIRHFNDQEMMPGMTLEVVWRDSARSVERWISAYEAFRARGIPVLMSTETVGLEAYHDKLEQDKMPLVTDNSAQEIVYPPRWYYFSCSTWAEQFTVVADYIMENWQEERPPRLAFMATDSSFGRQIEVTGTKYAQGLGFEILPMEIVAYVPIDTTTQLLRLKERGTDFVYVSGLIVTAGPILRDAERLGLLDKIHFSGNKISAGQGLIEMAGVASEGYLFPRTCPSILETELPGIKLIWDVQTKYHGEVVAEEEYIGGWVAAAVACEAVRRAEENVGYENLSGPAIKEALDSIKGFDVDGLATITYNPPDDHGGCRKVAAYQIRGGEIVRVSDWQAAPILVPEG